MKFEGMEIEIRPLDSIETRIDSNNLEDLDFIGYYDSFKELYDKIDNLDNDEDRYQNIEKLQKIAKLIFSDNKNFSSELLDSVYRKKELRDSILQKLKQVDNRQLEVYMEVREQAGLLRQEFKKDFFTLLREQGLDCDNEKIINLIDSIDVRFISPVLEHENNFTRAFYNSTHYVAFKIAPAFLDQNHFKKCFYHEFLHVLSNDYENIISYKNKSNNTHNEGSQSFGFRFGALNKLRFEWLNEAFTEQLALKMCNKEASTAYEKERNPLDLLGKKKKSESILDFNLLIKIYFRHLKLRGEGDYSAIDEWRKFSKDVDHAFGSRFLVKLDLYISEYGIVKAFETISSWPDGDPHSEDLKVGITDKK